MISPGINLNAIATRERISDEAAHALAACEDIDGLVRVAGSLRDHGHGDIVSYSRKVFIPLTHLCRDSCHYCIFAHPPRRGQAAFMTREQVLAVAKAGARAGCKEALFTLGDKPELRYAVAARELAALGHGTTLSYLAEMAALVLAETGLLPHINAGVMGSADLVALRSVAVSQGLMLETISERLSERGGAHFGSPDKRPAVRLETHLAAGEAGVPFTSGLLVGIGETRHERISALLRLREIQEKCGHLQEFIIQNFRAKPGTRMATAVEPSLDEHLWTIAIARIILGSGANIQAPPNLQPDALVRVIAAGINDWGGVSPVTPDHVNPEAPWPEILRLAQVTAEAGKTLTERLAIYPEYLREPQRWLDPNLLKPTFALADSEGFARPEVWTPGAMTPPPARVVRSVASVSPGIRRLREVIKRAHDGESLGEGEIVGLFAARGAAFEHVTEAADDLRKSTVGDNVCYVVNRNINYTNVCYFHCKFCAFSKGKLNDDLRGTPYDLELEEISRRTAEAWDRGATEVCLQGGIHPNYTGDTYLQICRVIKKIAPDIHIHAFSPLEVWQGAATLGLTLQEFLTRLKDAGLASLPGTAAEILDDEVRAVICPDKISTAQWLEVMETAHQVGLRSTATIMFGHVERPVHWARHLIRVRELQVRTGGFTEFVPLPFVPMETPLFLKHPSRRGPTFREAILMHSVARLALHPVIPNIQTSWVKMGPEGAARCLQAGANDIGGTLMNESITRAAGAQHGQEMPPAAMTSLIERIGRVPRQRTTFYGAPPTCRTEASFSAQVLAPPINTPLLKAARGLRRALFRG